MKKDLLIFIFRLQLNCNLFETFCQGQIVKDL